MVLPVVDHLFVSLHSTSENQNRIKYLDDFILLNQKKSRKKSVQGKNKSVYKVNKLLKEKKVLLLK
jgi:hypothetical protein